MYSLDTAGDSWHDVTLTDWASNVSGIHDAGVVVAVNAGALPGDSPANSTASDDKLRSYLGASHASSSHIGYSSYPYNDMTVQPASGQAPALGITLRETLAYDENGEKMLYYQQKLDEQQGVLPGQSVPVLTRGTVLLHENAIHNPDAAVAGAYLSPGFDPEQVGVLVASSAVTRPGDSVGYVMATGKNSDDTGSSKFLCKLSFNGGK